MTETNWKEIAESYKIMLDATEKELAHYKNKYLTLLDALANPEKYEE